MHALSAISQAVDKVAPESPRYTHNEYHNTLVTLNNAYCKVNSPSREWTPAVQDALRIIHQAFNAVRREQVAIYGELGAK